jgi:hypothetical protein
MDARLAELEGAVSDEVDDTLSFSPDPETPSDAPAEREPAAAPAEDLPAEALAPGSDVPAAEIGDEPVLSEATQKLLDKFDGDINKAVDWAWRTNNRAAESARKIKELEERLAAGDATRRPADAPTRTATETPSTADTNEEINGILAEKNDLIQTNIRVRATLGKVQASIDDLSNKRSYWVRQIVSPGANSNPDQAREEIAAIDSNLSGLEVQKTRLTDWQALARTTFQGFERQERLERRLLSLNNERATERQEAETRQVSDYRDVFFSSVDAVARQAGIPATDMPGFREYARRSAVAYLHDTDEKTRITNPSQFAARVVREWTGSVSARARQQLATYTRTKVQDARGGRGTVAPGARRPAAAPAEPEPVARPLTGIERLNALRDRIESEVDDAHTEAYTDR